MFKVKYKNTRQKDLADSGFVLPGKRKVQQHYIRMMGRSAGILTNLSIAGLLQSSRKIRKQIGFWWKGRKSYAVRREEKVAKERATKRTNVHTASHKNVPSDGVKAFF